MFNFKMSLVVLVAGLCLGGLSLHADCPEKPCSFDGSCSIQLSGRAAPQIKRRINTEPYCQLYHNLTKNDNIAILEHDLDHLYNSLPDMCKAEKAYDKLFHDAREIVRNYCPEQPPKAIRIVIIAANGMVIVDSEKGTRNTLVNFLAGAIDENFNSRIAILDAQAWPAGVGLERQFDFNNFRYGSAVAIRLGGYLDSLGTVRLTIFD